MPILVNKNKTKRNNIIWVLISIMLVGIIVVIFCIKLNDTENKDIYPKGHINNVKIFDLSNKEIQIVLSQEDINYIIQTLKKSNKELSQGYDSGMYEVNIDFSDSTIQLLRKDKDTVYYVFHNWNYNAICYKVQSKELSEYINKIIESTLN